jgi:putative membrane protein
MPLLFMMSHSVIYELVEWLAALVFGGELGVAYLGTQGDVWDAQKDMALAACGAALGLLFVALRKVSGLQDAQDQRRSASPGHPT